MNKFLFIIFIFVLSSCSSTKKVLICGDHECVNKEEAKQYFADNLSLEVRIIDKKKSKSFNLVEINSAEIKKKSVKVVINEDQKEKLRILTKEEIQIKKQEVSKKKQLKDAIRKEKIKKNEQISTNKKIVKLNMKSKVEKVDKIDVDNKKNKNKNAKIKNKKTVKNDICLILQNCNIDEIAEYLLKRNNKKSFPDLTNK